MNDFSPGPQPGRRLTAVRSLVMAAALLILAGSLPAAADAPPENRACLRCHAMSTLAYRDGTTGNLIDLSIDPRRLAGSVHGKLACVKCHVQDYAYYPHPQRTKPEPLDCVGCHREGQARTHYPFQAIADQYAKSIHGNGDDPKLRDFGCHSCHDPHALRVSTPGKALAEIVADDNRVCLSCHVEVSDPLRDRHHWLPNRQAHWAAVRCVECHTPMATLADADQRVSHQILPARQSNRDCVNCHSGNQRLLSRLYAYRSQEELARDGLFAKAVFNEAYVVGMSRSPLIDRLSLAFIGLTGLGLIAHGVGRYLAYRRAGEKHA
ncbi:ammonia-forming cytochrome c nitrite reductase subunit c552 [uncultured Thiodictyon sp.]|uniref:ammonia-forming cytochrome c nitrite reductase subunit c552 n=1 Tax=uncultured Thiodictyon sp. TaxID=1846217 RepID=UPI0025DC3EA6|nr:ammonia-forming cytochrome c nitrite reductase subunit c552 [uncultured Thiodictyon sp.]